MSKVLDWDSIAKQNGHRTNRMTGEQIPTGKQAFAKAYQDLAKTQDAASRRAQVEPILKQELIKAIINRSPIKVLQPIRNYTEGFGGQTNNEDDDGFYNSSPSAAADSILKSKFQQVIETIPMGTELVFKSWDKQLGQWIFKSTLGQEYAIYDKSVILVGEGNHTQAVENPGLYGLLYHTNIIDVLND